MRDYSATQFPINPYDQETVIKHAIEADHIILQFFTDFSYNPPDPSTDGAMRRMLDFYRDALREWLTDEPKKSVISDHKVCFKLNITEENRRKFPDLHSLLSHFIAAWRYAVIAFADSSNSCGDAIIYERKENLPPHPDSSIIQSSRSSHPDSLEDDESLSEEKYKEILTEWYEFQKELPKPPFQYRPSEVIYGNSTAYGMDVVFYALEQYKYTDLTVSPDRPHPQLAFDLDGSLTSDSRFILATNEIPSLGVHDFRAEHHPRLTTGEDGGTVGMLKKSLDTMNLYPPLNINDYNGEWIDT